MCINDWQLEALFHLEEAQLLTQAQAGCGRSLEQLMVAYEPWVQAIVSRQGLGGLSVDEALQGGRQGLWQAIVNYDPSSGRSFWQTAWPRISATVYRLSKQVEWRRRRARERFVPLGQGPAAPDPAQVQEGVLIQEALDELVQRLPKRLRHIVVAYYGLAEQPPATFGQIGQQLGFSRQRIWQLQREALARMSHPPHSQRLRSLLGRHSVADYQAAEAQIERWLRQRGGRCYGC
jgi:RNA polymerase sigma factor (sigma-70 family)